MRRELPLGAIEVGGVAPVVANLRPAGQVTAPQPGPPHAGRRSPGRWTWRARSPRNRRRSGALRSRWGVGRGRRDRWAFLIFSDRGGTNNREPFLFLRAILVLWPGTAPASQPPKTPRRGPCFSPTAPVRLRHLSRWINRPSTPSRARLAVSPARTKTLTMRSRR